MMPPSLTNRPRRDAVVDDEEEEEEEEDSSPPRRQHATATGSRCVILSPSTLFPSSPLLTAIDGGVP
jgi:hypothetical protein